MEQSQYQGNYHLLSILRHAGFADRQNEILPVSVYEMLGRYFNDRAQLKQIELVNTISTTLFINSTTELRYGKSDIPGSPQLTSEG